jgi:hypothetical protein
MAFANKREKGFIIALSKKESKELGFEDGKRYDVVKAKDGIWLVLETEGSAKAGEKKEAEAGLAKPVEEKQPEQKQQAQQGKRQESQNQKDGFECLEKEGFTVCKSPRDARILSEKFKEEIEKGEIKGIKGFDGLFYIIKGPLYEKHRKKVLETIQANKEIGTEGIGQKTGVDRIVARIVCEFLKEEGEIIEKRKEKFQAI